MHVDLTARSAAEYDLLRSGQMTPAMAAEYLREGRIVPRGFAEVLRELYPLPDLQIRLQEALLAGSPEASPESTARKLRNWLSGQSIPASREDIFQIAFALGLSEAEAGTLLGLCTGYGIHYRDGREVVYAWFLRNGRSYPEARSFFETLPPVPRPEDIPPNLRTHVTRELRADFQRVHSLQDLRECYLANLEQLGALHVRAYSYFEKYLNLLIRPSSDWGEEREPDYSIEAVMDQYLSLHMPSGRSRRNYSVVQKLIKHNWPNATLLKNIRLHREDVPRKLLLLLYVITENGLDEGYSELDEEYLTAQDRLEDHWWSLNAILSDCGMPLLDPRNAADWLVLYAVTATDEPMSQRMEKVIELMFADVTEKDPAL